MRITAVERAAHADYLKTYGRSEADNPLEEFVRIRRQCIKRAKDADRMYGIRKARKRAFGRSGPY